MCASLPAPRGGSGPPDRRMRGVVGGNSRVRLASGRTDGNAKRHGDGPSAMRRPSHRAPPASLSNPPDVAGVSIEGVMHLCTTDVKKRMAGWRAVSKKRWDTIGAPRCRKWCLTHGFFEGRKMWSILMQTSCAVWGVDCA
jgi:hypothetical protein